MFQSDVDTAARETLRLIGPDPQNWIPDRQGIDHNVAIIGGGQSGSAFAFALRRAGIGKVTLIDAAGDAASSGPWLSSARMNKLPKELYAHTLEAIDFEKLRDRSVAVLGSAASAFDAAAVALEAGAREVHLFARRDRLASEPVIRTRGYPGAYDNYGSLPDALRWHQAIRFRRAGSTPPPDAVARAVKFPNFHLHLAAPWTSAKPFGRRLLATTPHGDIAFDFVIAGTGYRVDLAKTPELAAFSDKILLWRDRFSPSADEQDDPRRTSLSRVGARIPREGTRPRALSP